jgi:hypothetical protein
MFSDGQIPPTASWESAGIRLVPIRDVVKINDKPIASTNDDDFLNTCQYEYKLSG